jgi:hypothetical protein
VFCLVHCFTIFMVFVMFSLLFFHCWYDCCVSIMRLLVGQTAFASHRGMVRRRASLFLFYHVFLNQVV